MTAASYWSLLAPAIEMATQSSFYGEHGQYAFIPVSIGFTLGAAFVYYADTMMTALVRYLLLNFHHFTLFTHRRVQWGEGGMNRFADQWIWLINLHILCANI